MKKLKDGSVLLDQNDQKIIKEMIDYLSLRQNWGITDRDERGIPLGISYLNIILNMITGNAK